MEKNNKRNINLPEFDPYQPESLPLFEALYGKHLISLGGLAAIENLFSGLNIRGLNALDLGFGLGGVAFYLAKKYQMNIAGIEVHPWMVQYAKDHIPKGLADSLEFNTYTSKGELPYRPESFDLVYSKGVLNHIADKSLLFQQIHSVLKPNGLFLITDWIYPEATNDSSAPLICETKESYEDILVSAGFCDINFRNESPLFFTYAHELLMRMANHQTLIQQKYGEEVFLSVQKQHQELMKKIQQHQKIATRIVASRKN